MRFTLESFMFEWGPKLGIALWLIGLAVVVYVAQHFLVKYW